LPFSDRTSGSLMHIGIFAKTFQRGSFLEVFEVVSAHGLRCVQFNMACAGLVSMPDQIDLELMRAVRETASRYGIGIAAVSGTFNMIHPDARQRSEGLRRLRVLAEACAGLGTSVITLCTGTRDAENMWRRHPDNDTREAWRDLLASMEEAVAIGEKFNVTMAFEPEVANVIDSAKKGRELLNAIRSPRLKVVMDPANLFHAGELPRMREILDEAFALLGRDLVIAHAKDLSRDGEAGHEAAGQGILDYDYYIHLLRQARFDGPLILHSLSEEQVDGCVGFLRGKMGI
jgi:sugar phosphate isomerase/epimerase